MHIEQARELLQTKLWTEFCVEIDKRIVADTGRLLECRTDEVVKLQEKVKAYQAIKRIPQDVIDREEDL